MKNGNRLFEIDYGEGCNANNTDSGDEAAVVRQMVWGEYNDENCIYWALLPLPKRFIAIGMISTLM